MLKLLPGYMLPGSLPRNGLGSKLRTALSLPQLVIGFLGHWIELRQAVSLFVAHSPEAVELLRTNGVPDSQIRFSAPGLEPQLRVPRAPRTTGPVRFGFVGRPCAEKGVQTLVKAWQLLPRTAAVELHFWGNPETGEPEVVAQVRSLCAGDSRAVFHGPFAREQIDSVYDGMDALLVPSEWFDNCPFVISEAFAAGLPVLGSDFGGIKSMIRHEVDGLLVAMGDACAWAAALARLAANPQTVQAFSRNVLPPRDAREHVRDLRVFFAELARNGARG